MVVHVALGGLARMMSIISRIPVTMLIPIRTKIDIFVRMVHLSEVLMVRQLSFLRKISSVLSVMTMVQLRMVPVMRLFIGEVSPILKGQLLLGVCRIAGKGRQEQICREKGRRHQQLLIAIIFIIINN